MAKFALVSPANQLIEFREYETMPNAVTASVTKPRLVPVVLEDVIYDPVAEVREGPTTVVETTRVVERYTKRAKTALEIADMKTAKLVALRAEADRRLAAATLTPQQQIRALSRIVNLLVRHTDITSWPAAQQTAITTMLAKLDGIDSVRAQEETKVLEIAALTTPVAIAAYNETAGWV